MASAVNIPVKTQFEIRVSQEGFSQGTYVVSFDQLTSCIPPHPVYRNVRVKYVFTLTRIMAQKLADRLQEV